MNMKLSTPGAGDTEAWTGEPGTIRFMGSWKGGHDLMIEQQQQHTSQDHFSSMYLSSRHDPLYESSREIQQEQHKIMAFVYA